ncbi:hypothetical protein ABIA32_002745 [Streptacidiphilus sp. MAP12-20]|uniref:hypothetical protein n=1 Tax=Streptacidiphilus sp. MAP12-20 TaxID=3156299 RepID=UPI0035166864
MNQQVISVLAGLGTFGLFAGIVRVLPRRWTTPTPPTPAPFLHQGEPHQSLNCRNGETR